MLCIDGQGIEHGATPPPVSLVAQCAQRVGITLLNLGDYSLPALEEKTTRTLEQPAVQRLIERVFPTFADRHRERIAEVMASYENFWLLAPSAFGASIITFGAIRGYLLPLVQDMTTSPVLERTFVSILGSPLYWALFLGGAKLMERHQVPLDERIKQLSVLVPSSIEQEPRSWNDTLKRVAISAATAMVLVDSLWYALMTASLGIVEKLGFHGTANFNVSYWTCDIIFSALAPFWELLVTKWAWEAVFGKQNS